MSISGMESSTPMTWASRVGSRGGDRQFLSGDIVSREREPPRSIEYWYLLVGLVPVLGGIEPPGSTVWPVVHDFDRRTTWQRDRWGGRRRGRWHDGLA